MKIKFWCDTCTGDRLELDAVVEWNYDTQTYEFLHFGSWAWCNDCCCDHTYSSGTAEQHREIQAEMEDKAVW